nr:hypothetical protein [Kofleriaceae bacterium]
MIWGPFVLALLLGLVVSAGLYFAYMWPSVEPADPPAPSGDPPPARSADPPAAAAPATPAAPAAPTDPPDDAPPAEAPAP